MYEYIGKYVYLDTHTMLSVIGLGTMMGWTLGTVQVCVRIYIHIYKYLKKSAR